MTFFSKRVFAGLMIVGISFTQLFGIGASVPADAASMGWSVGDGETKTYDFRVPIGDNEFRIGGISGVTTLATLEGQFDGKVEGLPEGMSSYWDRSCSSLGGGRVRCSGNLYVRGAAARIGTFPVVAGYRMLNDEGFRESRSFKIAVAKNGSLGVTTGLKEANGTDAHTITVNVKSYTGAAIDLPEEGIFEYAGIHDLSSNLNVGDFRRKTAGVYEASVTSNVPATYLIQSEIDSVKEIRFERAGAAEVETRLWITSGVKQADGVDAHWLTMRVNNMNGVPVSGLGKNLVTDTSFVKPEQVTYVKDWEETQPGSGVYEAQVVTSEAGVYPFSIFGGKTDTHKVTGVWVVSVADQAHTGLVVTSGTRVADGVDAHWLTMRVNNMNGVPVSGLGKNLVTDTSFVKPEQVTYVKDWEETQPGSGVYEAQVVTSEAGVYPFSIFGGKTDTHKVTGVWKTSSGNNIPIVDVGQKKHPAGENVPDLPFGFAGNSRDLGSFLSATGLSSGQNVFVPLVWMFSGVLIVLFFYVRRKQTQRFETQK